LQPVRKVPCPRCGAPAAFGPENKWRPFCSERCKIIDLGDWAAERYRVPVEEQKDQSAKDEDPEDDAA
jgi:endogenous inhibitor of DNA gyrase (YacG/DUF329 family)